MLGKKITGFLLTVGLIISGVFYLESKQNRQDFKPQVENGVIGVFHGQEVMPPTIDLAVVESVTNVLGEIDPTAEKRIYIDLSKQTLSAYEGDSLYMKALVSTGKWGLFACLEVQELIITIYQTFLTRCSFLVLEWRLVGVLLFMELIGIIILATR